MVTNKLQYIVYIVHNKCLLVSGDLSTTIKVKASTNDSNNTMLLTILYTCIHSTTRNMFHYIVGKNILNIRITI